ncbi:MAG: hypothetical protein OXU32_05255 [Gammaproteobacteria bacterium]|nr:hypothetical protein [Gammaproteobacteria bacterium]
MRNRTARSHRFTPLAFIMALGLFGCAQDDAAAPAGAVTRYELGEPEAVSGDFGSVDDIRVRRDGSLLVADRTSGELVLLDPELGTRTVVGSRGEGPGEYQAPSGIWPLPGDSTLLLDVSNNRLTVLTPDLSFGATRPMFEVDPDGGILLLNPQVIDDSGRIYTTNGFSMNLAGRGSGDGSGTDSVPVVRATLDDLTPDTVARLAPPESTSRMEMRSSQGNRMVTMQQTPYSPSDSWGVAPDGSVAIARAADYRLEWISSDGSVRSGAPVAWEAVPAGQAEKEAWVRQQNTRSVQMATFATGGGGGASSMAGAAARTMTLAGASDDVDDYEWPETLPAFTGSILIDPEGRAWLRRHQPVGAPFLYDIFTPDAEHAGTVEIAEGHTVMGFGDGVVYATFRDEVDLVYIARYRLPEM